MAVAAGGTLTAAGQALAGYGRGAARQIELSASASAPGGGGLWLRFVLNSDGTGGYRVPAAGTAWAPSTTAVT